MKSHFGLALGLGLLVAGGTAAQAQQVSPVPVFVNGGRLENDAYLLQNVGRSVLPMRTLFESLGAHVEWDSSQRAVYAWKGDGNGIRLGVGERSAQQLRMSRSPAPGHWGQVTGSQSLDAPAMMIDGKVFVPLRFASEALNADVRYASNEPAVYIKTEGVAGSHQDTEPDRPPRRPMPSDRGGDRGDREDRGDRPGRGPGRMGPRAIADALNLELTVPAGQIDRDEPIRFDVTVTNKSNRPVTIPFQSGQQFDIQVLQEGRVVWTWSHGRAFPQIVQSMTLGPGQSKQFSGRWDLHSERGNLIAPGRYLVRARLTPSFDQPEISVEDRIDVGR